MKEDGIEKLNIPQEEKKENKDVSEKGNLYDFPFKNNLIDFPVKTISVDNPEGRLILKKQIENDPEHIVKISRKEHIYRFFPETAPVESSQTIEIQNEAKKQLEELNNKYGISVAPFEYVIGADKEGRENVLYSVSDVIHGNNLITALKEKKFASHIEETEKLLTSLMDYFRDKFRNDNYCLGDVANLGNYIYGRRKNEKEDRLYFIDTEPVLIELKGSQKKELFNSRVKDILFSQIEYIEKETGKELTDIRKEHADFVEEVEKTLS